MPAFKILVFALLTLVSSSTFAQWHRIILNPNAKPEDYVSDAAFINADTGFVGTSWGVLYATTDGGVTWIPDTIGTDVTITRVAFPSAQIGYMTVQGSAYNGGTVLKTTDGGKQWFNTGQGFAINNGMGLYFFGVDTGFVANDAGVVYETNDGGQNWSWQFAGSDGAIYNLRFINDSVGYIFQNNNGLSLANISISRDRGNTWVLYSNLAFFFDYSDCAILYSDSVVIGLSVNQLIRIKTDQSEPEDVAIFNPPVSPSFSTGLHSRNIFFIDTSIGMVAYGKAVIKTQDGGNNWTLTDTSAFIGYELQNLVSVNTNKWLVMGGYGQLYITENQGGIATGITDLSDKNDITIYPNPATDLIKITPSSNTGNNYSVEISNILGQTVYKGYTNNNKIDVSNLASGIYLLRLEENGVSQTTKLIKY